MPNAMPMTITVDGKGNTRILQLGSSVKVVECRYNCGNYFVVTTMCHRPPGHIECAIKAARDNMEQLQAKSGPYYDKWRARMAGWAATLNS